MISFEPTTPDDSPTYSYTTIEYGPLEFVSGIETPEWGTPDLTLNFVLEQKKPLKYINQIVTVGGEVDE